MTHAALAEPSAAGEMPTTHRRRSWPHALVWAVMGAAWIALIFAILRHEPFVDYDLMSHLHYAQTLATGRLPMPADTREFFSPPLAYLPAAAMWAAGFSDVATLRGWQSTQILYAAGLLLAMRAVMQRCGMSAVAQLATLLAMIAASVWWRSFALIRPEALMTPLLVLGVLTTLPLVDRKASPWRAVLAGAVWAAAALTRQWGVLALISVAAWVIAMLCLRRIDWRTAVIATATILLLCTPFYLLLYLRHGSLTAFNRVPKEQKLSWVPHPLTAAKKPFRDALAGRPVDILYADTFGDYWMYYLVEGKRKNGLYLQGVRLVQGLDGVASTNINDIRPYVTLVLRASIPLAVLLLIAIPFTLVVAPIYAKAKDDFSAAALLLLAIVVGTAIGYAWFVSSYSVNENTDTTKATYLVQIWPITAMLFGTMVDRIGRRSTVAAIVIVCVATATVAVNCGTFFSRYSSPMFSTTWH